MLLSMSFDRRQRNCEIFGITKAEIARSKPNRVDCGVRLESASKNSGATKKPGKFSRVEEMSPLSGFRYILMTKKKHSRVKNHKESCRHCHSSDFSLLVIELEEQLKHKKTNTQRECSRKLRSLTLL